MKFRIIRDGYEKRGDTTPYGTIPLRSKRNGRDFFLSVEAEALMTLPDGEYDFDGTFGAFDREKRQALLDGLTLLSAFGAAELFDEPRRSSEFCRVAGEKDYCAVAALITDDTTLRFGQLPIDPVYMSQDSIRARQFNNEEYNFLYIKNDEIKAVLTACMPQASSYSAAFRLLGIAIGEGCDAEDVIDRLLECAMRSFCGEFRICRYLCFDPNDPFAKTLLSKGFKETARLFGEAEDGADVTVYDLEETTC